MNSLSWCCFMQKSCTLALNVADFTKNEYRFFSGLYRDLRSMHSLIAFLIASMLACILKAPSCTRLRASSRSYCKFVEVQSAFSLVIQASMLNVSRLLYCRYAGFILYFSHTACSLVRGI